MIVVNFIFVGLLLVIMQTTVCMPSPVWLLAPDCYYVLVAYLAYRLDLLRSLMVLFPLVCMLDVLSGTVLGMYAILCFSGYFLLRLISGKLPVNESLYQIPLVGLSYLVVSWGVYLVLRFFEPGELISWSWWRMIVRALLVTVLTYPLFYLFDVVLKYSHRSFFPWNRLRLRTDNRRRRQD
jgi:rod shape-determining protein MreD